MENLFAILHEDARLLVVNKPAGLVCHPTKGDEFSSLIGRARLYLNRSLSANEVGGEGRGEVALSTSGPQTQNPGLPRQSAAGAGPSTLNCTPNAPARDTNFAACSRKRSSSEFGAQPSTHLINRLDRETSGVVLVAKDAATAGELGKIWETRAVQKEYLAIVHGRVRDNHGLIDAPLGRDRRSRVAVKDGVRPDGAPAQTEYWVERRFNRPRPRSRPRQSESEDDGRGRGGAGSEFRLQAAQPSTLNPQLSTYSLLRVIPRTGRKHQIRIHLAHLGHPVVGDKLYGGDEDLYLALVENRLTPEQRARLILPYHALHARAVRFTWRGRAMEFSCAPEPWFLEFAGAG